MPTNFWLRSCPCLLKINHPAGMMATILPESRRWASKDHVKYTAPLAVSKKLLFSDRYGLLALRNRAVTTLCTVRCRLNTEWNYNPFRIDFTNPNQVVNYYRPDPILISALSMPSGSVSGCIFLVVYKSMVPIYSDITDNINGQTVCTSHDQSSEVADMRSDGLLHQQ